MVNVLFVCLGNICRSPLAEGIFLDLIEKRGLQAIISCDSSGTGSYHIGELPDKRTRKNAELNGIKLTHHARKFVVQDFYEFDFIIPMDESNLKNINSLKPHDSKAEIFLMREFDTKEKNKNVPDPYYGNAEEFEEVFQILNRCCTNFLRFINDQILKNEAS